MGGFVVRTAAEGVSEVELLADIRYLKKKWASIQSATQAAGKAQALHEELPLALRACRDLIQQDTEVVRIDSSETFQAAKAFVKWLSPRS